MTDYNPLLNNLIRREQWTLDPLPPQLHELLSQMVQAIVRLELQSPPLPSTGETSGPSSVAMTGHAPRQSGSSMATLVVPTGSPLEDLMSCLRVGISAFTNWHPSISPLTVSHLSDGRTLQVTCSLPIGFGETAAGSHGVAAHEVVK